MGTYWQAINLNKKQTICPHDAGGGAKLGELTGGRFAEALMHVLGASFGSPRFAGAWIGDHVQLINDSTHSHICEEICESGTWTNITIDVLREIDRANHICPAGEHACPDKETPPWTADDANCPSTPAPPT